MTASRPATARRLTRRPLTSKISTVSPAGFGNPVIATVEVRGETPFDGFDDLRRKLIAEAALVGGDALIVGPESTRWRFIHHPTALIRSETKELAAQVIVFSRPLR